MLTAKQEKFAQIVASGKSQTEAYRASYNIEKMQESTVHNEAYLLMQNQEVAKRIKEIQANMQKKAEITALTLIEELKEIEALAKQPIHGKEMNSYDLTNWIKVKQEVAKLLGLYAPEKRDTKTSSESEMELAKALNKLAEAKSKQSK